MKWFLTLSTLAILAAGKTAVGHESVSDDPMRIVYCYTRLSASAQNLKLAPEKRERAKHHVDALFPRYQAAIENSKGTLTEEALQLEAEKARDVYGRRLSISEFFMLAEACEALAQKAARADP